MTTRVPVGRVRRLVVNADDFGRSPGINRGIMHAYRHGIVTSASLMVRWSAAADAARFARAAPELGIGLHVDLAEWVHDGIEWGASYEVVRDDDPDAVTEETWRQVERFDQLVGTVPSHIDSHQHVHRNEPAHAAIALVCRELGVPLRMEDPGITHCGAFHGQSGTGEPLHSGISITALVDLLGGLAPGVTELLCHPGLGDESGSVYGVERDLEVAALCDPAVRAAVNAAGIELITFRDVSRTSDPTAPDDQAVSDDSGLDGGGEVIAVHGAVSRRTRCAKR
jgi:predicted glycoside hydrolase/deacetylase ChbG (UPF0249 family)